MSIISIKAELRMLKENLNQTDYKILKCYEFFMMGKELPYNLTELHDEREAWRNQINILEQEIANLQ